MTVVPSFESITVLSSARPTMDDRKRGIAPGVDDPALPNKRQALAANGAAMRMEPDKEKDVEDFQKGAIFRQMQEYKRERNTFEAQLKDLTKHATFHDDHIRLIDAWLGQLLDEISLINNSPTAARTNLDPFDSSLLTEKTPIFEEHLSSRSLAIKRVISEIYGRAPQTVPEVKQLQERVSALLASETTSLVELQKLNAEKEQLSERLENAYYRYLVAEKKLDRAKSNSVKRLEQPAIQKRDDDSGKVKQEDGVNSEQSEINGDLNSAAYAELRSARASAEAALERRKLQVEQLELNNKRLNEELTATKTRAAAATDDEYATTALFRTTKMQTEDMIKRINDLKATNTQLREEAQKLQAERTAYRSQVDEEMHKNVNENEGQLARSEADLVRIRGLRDDLAADLDIVKKGQVNTAPELAAAQEIVGATEERVKSLESEVERLKLRLGEVNLNPTDDLDSVAIDAEELRVRLRKVEAEHNLLLSSEIPSLQAAYSKFSSLAKKLSDTSAWQEELKRLGAEKAKADQKYFATMKLKEARDGEVRALKAQNGKTSEIVTQLKDAEQSSRVLVASLEKQVAEARNELNRLQGQVRALEQKTRDGDDAVLKGLKETLRLKEMVVAKDKASAETESDKRKVEVELTQAKARLDDTIRQVETLKKQAEGGSGTADDWRRIAICPVCNYEMRNTALKLCGHCFCHKCVNKLIEGRSRKCPSCGKSFGSNDFMSITLA